MGRLYRRRVRFEVLRTRRGDKEWEVSGLSDNTGKCVCCAASRARGWAMFAPAIVLEVLRDPRIEIA